MTTDYPFGDVVSITVTSSGQLPALYIRIPHWASDATAKVGAGAAAPISANGTLWKVPPALAAACGEACSVDELQEEIRTGLLIAWAGRKKYASASSHVQISVLGVGGRK